MSDRGAYYESKGISLYLGDCLELLRDLPKGIVITDPPYNIGTPALGVDMSRGKSRKMGKDFGEFDEGSLGPETWLHLMPDLVVTFYDALKSDRLLSAARQVGFEVVQDFHFVKTNPPVPMRSVGFAWATESGYVLRRAGSKHRHNDEAGISPNWFQDSVCSGRERTPHPAQKKLSVMLWLVNHWSFPGDLVIDPFAGSGTTLRAAKDLGRRAVGIEKEEKWCKLAVERLGQEVLFAE